MKSTPALFTIAIIMIILVFSTVPGGSVAMSKHPKENQSPEESVGWKKLDLRLREAWKEATQSGDDGRVFECLLKTKSRATGADREKLKAAGFKYRTFIGQIVTGSVAAKDLPAVSNLDTVEAMELAVPLSLKKQK